MKVMRAVAAFFLSLTGAVCAEQSPWIGVWQNPGGCPDFPAYVLVSATDRDHIGFAMIGNRYNRPQLIAPMPAVAGPDDDRALACPGGARVELG